MARFQDAPKLLEPTDTYVGLLNLYMSFRDVISYLNRGWRTSTILRHSWICLFRMINYVQCSTVSFIRYVQLHVLKPSIKLMKDLFQICVIV